MYKLSLSQGPAEGISREQLREQIRAQVQQATADARQAARQAQAAAQEAGRMPPPGQPNVPVGPIGVPIISVNGAPFDRGDMPPRVKDVSIAFVVMMAAVIIGLPIMRAIGKRIERGGPVKTQIPPETQSQIQHLMQSVDAIAIEVERISEGQRFATKLLSERKPDSSAS